MGLAGRYANAKDWLWRGETARTKGNGPHRSGVRLVCSFTEGFVRGLLEI